jgi:hypothetical protein
MRSGLKTTEFWLTGLAGLLATFLPDFPQESLLAVGSWVAARGVQKGFGLADGKRAWLTTEFWLSSGLSAMMIIFPDFPKEPVIGLIAYLASRIAAKKKQAVVPIT